MEGLVNYSSEDEQDERSYKRTAERGSPVNRGGGSYGGSGNAGSMGRSSYREEASENRHKSYSASNRSSSFQRDNKERYGPSRDARDSREFSNGHQRYDNRSTQHDRHFPRHGRDYKNEEINKRERPRPDERHNNRHSANNSSYNQNSRDNRSRYSGGNSFDNSRSRHYRSGRSDEQREERTERYSTSRPERQRHQYNKYTARNRRSHSRSRSRSRSRSQSKDRRISPVTERAERSAPSAMYDAESSPVREKITEKSQQNNTRSGEQSVNHIAPLMSLPLSDSAPKHPCLVAVTSTIGSGSASSKSNEPAVIQLPNYYNPSVMNPAKYAEQVQKRKLLWGAKKNEDTTAKWGNAQFSQDTDGKVASKFMRLMGMKNAAGTKNEAEEKEKEKEKATPAPDVKSREAMFSSMEHQYEVARQVTHTMRGVGLGFGISRPY